MKLRAPPAIIPLSAAVVLASAGPVCATEGGNSLNILGIRVPGAGLTPPAGVFLENDFYFYSGRVAGDISLPLGGQIAVGVKAKEQFVLPTVLWVTDHKLLGGNLGFTVTQPIGFSQVDANVAARGRSESLGAFADPIVGTQIGWSKGDFHWQTGARVNLPFGRYDKGALGNVSLHRWAEDVWGSATYLNPRSGLELSSELGVTFNGENHVTHYRSGDEFHLEGSIGQHFSKSFDAGVISYYYKQISGDSGSGAKLGPFEGRTTAVGVTAGYNFQIGKIPVSTRIKYVREFNEWRRLHGEGGFFTVFLPLWAPHR
jgi:hypothetical protein